MARTLNRLSAMKVAKVTAPGLYGDGAGLWLQVSATGAKSWLFRFTLDGRHRYMGLGALHTVSLAEARGKALEARKMVLDGIDPISARAAQRAAAKLQDASAVTFAQAAERYIAAHEAGWRNDKHKAQWAATLETYAYPVFGALPVAAVDVGLVLKVLEPIWTEKAETASRLRGRIEAVLDWAAARSLRSGENPARWRGHLDKLLPRRSKVARVEHHAALPYAELPAFMKELRQQEGTAARGLEFCVLTAARTGEVIGATWPEIDLKEGIWTVPAHRIKAGKEHRVPLVPAAVTILQEMEKITEGDFVFPGMRAKKGLSQMAFLMLLRRMGRADLTAHGFRSTFRDWAAERTNFPREVAEMALAHAVGDKVEAAYRRGDLFAKRRKLMEAWAGYCAAAPAKGNVVPLQGRAGG